MFLRLLFLSVPLSMSLSMLLGVFLFPPTAYAECAPQKELESGNKKVHLLELYTSEGCSSCPPAESWLNSLKDDPYLYIGFIPLAFHVDYWNQLGHSDPYSKPEFSNRQRDYASEWGNSRIYTPGFVLDGKEWRSLFKRFEKKALERTGNLVVKFLKSEDKFEVTYGGFGAERVFGAWLFHGLENVIKRGENRGKTLKHDFVVGSMTNAPLIKGKANLKLTKPKGKEGVESSLVFWVTAGNSNTPLQAVGGCLKM